MEQRGPVSLQRRWWRHQPGVGALRLQEHLLLPDPINTATVREIVTVAAVVSWVIIPASMRRSMAAEISSSILKIQSMCNAMKGYVDK